MITDIAKLTKELIKKYKTNDPFGLAQCLNIKILIEPLGNINGFYQSCPKNKVIHLNENLDEFQRIIVCAHELGHAVLHSKLNILFLEKNTFFVKNRYEVEANKFAAELLVSESLLEDCPSYFSSEQIASTLHMPKELIQLKLNK